MKDLKKKASAERHKAKGDARMITMQEEREWFRREALTLDRINKDQKRALHELKQELEAAKEEKKFAYDELVKAKAQCNSLLNENDTLRAQNQMRALPAPPTFNSTTFKLTAPEVQSLETEQLQIKYQVVLKENDELRHKCDRQVQLIQKYRGSYEAEKRSAKELMTDHANFF